MEKSVMFAIKRTISKFADPMSVNYMKLHEKEKDVKFHEIEKYMKLKRTNLMNSPTRAIVIFLLELLIFRILNI